MTTADSSNAGLAVLDFLISFLVISTCVVFFWRGSWGVLDVYLYPNNAELSAWICFGYGNLVMILTGLVQKYTSDINKLKNAVMRFVLSRIYIYIMATASVSQWRGIWNLQDYYSGKNWISATTSFVLGGGVICCLGCVKTIMAASPLVVTHDTDPVKLFRITGRLGSKANCSLWFVVDMVLTPLIVHTFVVVFWRGLWTLMNIYIYPHETDLSGIFSLVISLALAFPTLIGQHFIVQFVKTRKNKNKICTWILLKVFLVMASCVPVAHWRGIWTLQDVWLIPENKEFSMWVSHSLGFLGGVLVLSAKSIPVTGCLLDSSICEDSRPLINIVYFRQIWDKLCHRQTEEHINDIKVVMDKENTENNNNAIEFTFITHL